MRLCLTNYEEKVSDQILNIQSMANINSYLACFIRVVETEMSFTFLIWFICVQSVSFHVFSAIAGLFVFLLPFYLTYCYSLDENDPDQDQAVQETRSNKRDLMLFFGKIANVGLTGLGFFSLFISNFYFDIAEDIKAYKP